MAGDNCINDGGVNDGRISYGHVLLSHIVKYSRGGIDNCAGSAVNSASCTVAAIVSSENVARAAESIRVE